MFLRNPLETLINSPFYLVVVSIGTCRFPIDTKCTPVASVHPPIVAGVALDGKHWRMTPVAVGAALQLHQELLPPPLETGQSNTSTNRKQEIQTDSARQTFIGQVLGG
jgi:hypothetical protein